LETKENGGKFRSWLQDKDHDRLFEPDCLERALLVATRKDSDYFIGLLAEKGAKNLDECLKIAVAEKKPKARAAFLLIKAAKTGNAAIIAKLYKEQDLEVSNESWPAVAEWEDEGFHDVQEAVLMGKVSTVVPIKIARRNGQAYIRELLLMKTNVSKEGCYVRWHGLQLLQLEVAWLKKIPWVRIFVVSNNGFRSLPNEMETYLKKVAIITIKSLITPHVHA
jgi:leucine-rich repeat kinase 1/leucine-rich repeat kinase 2